MKVIEITIEGKPYPCGQTMGAMARFRELTGHDVNQMQGGVTELCQWLWCMVKSACARQGVEFDMSFMEFADRVSLEEIESWEKMLSEGIEPAEEDEKKSPPAS